jgi:uncharacterized protein (DUF1778 family)
MRQTVPTIRTRGRRKPPRTIEERAILILTARDTEALANMILTPPNPGPVLRRAAREYRKALATR